VRSAALDSADVSLVDGIRCTTRARTAIDLARELPLREGVAVLDNALHHRVPRSELVAVLARQHGWPGSAVAAAAVDRADGRAESVLESLARLVFAEAGVEPPVLQVQLWDGDRWTAERVDFCWPDAWVVVEVDGMAKYEADSPRGRRALRRRDYERSNRIADLGFEIVRFGWEDIVRDPDVVIARLRRALDRGRARHPTAARVRFAAAVLGE
jgi:uncharacterized protein DUF559